MTRGSSILRFDPYRLDLVAGQLFHGEEPVELRPQTWKLLRYLVERPGQLVPREELQAQVWGDVAVTAASLNQAILELRRALGDDAREARFIETVHRRGFRFVATVHSESGTGAEEGDGKPRTTFAPAQSPLCGRDRELAFLEQRLVEAAEGTPQVVFVTGDAGIGKTSLLRALAERHGGEETAGGLRLAWGYCISRRSEEEPFHPVIEALDRFSRLAEARAFRELVKRHAPSWLIHLPWLLEAGEATALRRELGLVTAARMEREVCALIEVLARDRPLVLVLEDLHWSDPATIDLIDAIAGQPPGSRLLVLATYRPVEAVVSEHPVAPLRRRLVQRGQASELALEPLAEPSVEEYLRRRFGGAAAPPRLAALVLEESDGNPLFMVTLVDRLESSGDLVQAAGGWRVEGSLEELVAREAGCLQGLVDDLLLDLRVRDRGLFEEPGRGTGPSPLGARPHRRTSRRRRRGRKSTP